MTFLSHIFMSIGAFFVGLAATLGITHPSPNIPVTPAPTVASSTAAVSAPKVTAIKDSSGAAIGSVSETPAAANKVFSDTNWAISFTLRPEWNVTPIKNALGQLHQLQLSSSKSAIFISKNEAVAVSGSLSYTTATRTIAGQSVQVRTYSKVEAPFAYYQMFSLKESDATYSFLLKSATADTSVLDSFIGSIGAKK